MKRTIPESDFFLQLLFGVTMVLSCLIIFFGFKPFNQSLFGTATWKTYRSNELGFEIQYPKEYVYTPCESNCVGDKLSYGVGGVGNDTKFVMTISHIGYLPKDRDFKAWSDQLVLDSYGQGTIKSNKLTTINKYKIRKIDYSSNVYEVDYYLSDDKSIIKITVNSNQVSSGTKKTVDQILSTFRFKDMVCKKGEYLKECKLGPCCCPVGSMCD